MNTTTTLRPIEETFEDVKHLILQEAKRHRRNYGGDLEELVAEGNLIFMKAYDGYDPRLGNPRNTGKFGRRIRFMVRTGLLDAHRTRASRAKHRVDADVDSAPDRKRFYLDHFLRELSPEAAALARTVVEKHRKARNHNLDWVYGMLKDIGWSLKQILKAFDEIADALR